jgi:hypothetical protein
MNSQKRDLRKVVGYDGKEYIFDLTPYRHDEETRDEYRYRQVMNKEYDRQFKKGKLFHMSSMYGLKTKGRTYVNEG